MARKLKVYELSMESGNYTQVPTIILNSQWLKASGFECGVLLALCTITTQPSIAQASIYLN